MRWIAAAPVGEIVIRGEWIARGGQRCATELEPAGDRGARTGRHGEIRVASRALLQALPDETAIRAYCILTVQRALAFQRRRDARRGSIGCEQRSRTQRQ